MTYKLGLIGTGTSGKRYLKTISEIDLAKPEQASESATGLSVAGLSNTRRSYPQAPGLPCKDWRHLLNSEALDGVIVAADPSLNLDIAVECNKLDLPLLLEKPAALSLAHVERMATLDIPIVINYSELYMPRFQALLAHPGKITHIYGINYGNGPFRDFSPLYDYAPHQLAACLALSPGEFQIVKQQAVKHPNDGLLYKLDLKLNDIDIHLVSGNGGDKRAHKFMVQYQDGTRLGYDAADIPQQEYQQPLINVLNVFANTINEWNEDEYNDQDSKETMTLSIHRLLNQLGNQYKD